MAYVFELGAPSGILSGPSDYVIEFALGYDTDAAELIAMSVALLKSDWGGDPHELVFGIRRHGIYSGRVSDFAFDHQTARRYVPKSRSGAVMLLVLRCVRELVSSVEPTTIVMETFEANLPPSAMEKYMRVISHLGRCGYDMTEYRRDGNDLKDYWLFTK